MFKNILLTIIRNLKRHKVNTFINVVGLAISIACAISIYAFIRHEYSFDHFHSKADRTYRVVEHYQAPDGLIKQGYVTFPLASAIREDIPEASLVSQVYNELEAVIKVPTDNSNYKLFEEDEMAYADPFFLQAFDYSYLAGNAEQALETSEDVVLTRKLADKFFGNQYEGRYTELIGKTLLINKYPHEISAVIEDIPRNSNVTFNLLLPYQTFESLNKGWVDNWDNTNSGSYVFITMEEGQTPGEVEKRFPQLVSKYHNEEAAARKSFHLQPLTDIHTNEDYDGTVYATPSVLITAFVMMGIIVMMTACINFINLATAQSVRRAKEIGIRKTLGSLRRQIIVQYMGETFVLVAIATLLGLWMASEFIEAFNSYLSVVIDFGLRMDYTVFYFLLVLLLFTILAAGYYPAHVLSSFRPVEALKQSITARNTGFGGKFSLRKSLIVVQFTISQILLIGTIVVAAQINFAREGDLGFRKDNIVMAYLPENDWQKVENFRQELSSYSDIRDYSFFSAPPMSSGNNWSSFRNPDDPSGEKHSLLRKFIDPNYIQTFDLELLVGRNLTENDRVFLDDSTKRYNALLNEEAVRTLGFASAEAAVGNVIKMDEREIMVTGVLKDFFTTSLQQEIQPCILSYVTNSPNFVGLHLYEAKGVHELPYLKSIWENLYPDQFFTAYTMKDYFTVGAFYVIEDVMYQAFRIFAFLSILIGCMGLYGLVSYLALQRQKEIGVRKTMGASVRHIVYLFSKEFTLLVFIAYLLAAPVGYFAMQAWLETFAYRVELSPWFFVIAFVASLLIAWLTVGYKSLSAALSNPVDSLRSE
jgi:ABC-type antimicrobial peptide transport system permease subunit